MGLTQKKFWKLSFYEWSLYLLKLLDDQKQKEREFRLEWDYKREMWAVMMNAFFKPKAGGKFKGQDLIKFSFDEKSTSEMRVPDMDSIKRRLGSKLKKKKSGVD